jgi:SAM-dependent methyltransferase
MEAGHRPLWRHFIRIVPDSDLSTKAVLDFGCNRGGFLRLLYALKPFRRGHGVDIAHDSIAAARSMAGAMPIEYAVATDLSRWQGQFDLAFSYEVIYLLPDIEAHAEQIWQSLRPHGVYYAVTGCHTDSPLWPTFRRVIGEDLSDLWEAVSSRQAVYTSCQVSWQVTDCTVVISRILNHPATRIPTQGNGRHGSVQCRQTPQRFLVTNNRRSSADSWRPRRSVCRSHGRMTRQTD